jgi:hypothetical protein
MSESNPGLTVFPMSAKPSTERVFPLDRHWKLMWILAAAIGIIGPGIWWIIRWRIMGDPDAWEPALLLILAPVLLAVAAWKTPVRTDPHLSVTWAGVGLEAWKLICLWVYIAGGGRLFEVFAAVAMIFDIGLLVVVLWFVHRTIHNERTQAAIRNGLFAVICGVLALFMHVTYSCTFALAFHDGAVRGRGGEALHYTGENWEERATFTFDAGETQIDNALEISERLELWPSSDEERRDLIRKDVDILMPHQEGLTQTLRSERREEIVQELIHNITNWKNLTDQLKKPDSPAINGDPAWRIRIVGHASDQVNLSKENREWDNYRVSTDRAQYIFLKLNRALAVKGVKTDWALAAVSNADQAMAGDFAPSHDHKLSVQVFVEKKVGGLTLLDYLYFMTYTISTTGYGDLVPRTPFAKLLTSIANLFEVLFLVVIINLVFIYGSRDAAANPSR